VWEVTCYVAYRQLQGIVFCSDPVLISLRQMVVGTGLSKTAVVSAVHDATAAGILSHERRLKGTLGTLCSQYAINWQATVECSTL
jgi:hypothetical protein